MHAGERRFAQPAGIYYTKTQNKTTTLLASFHVLIDLLFTKTLQAEVQIGDSASVTSFDWNKEIRFWGLRCV